MWLRELVAFLIAVPVHYLAHVFWKPVLIANKIIVKSEVDQVYTNGQGTNCCLTRPLISIIASSFLNISTKRLGVCFCQGSRLTINQLAFFFFMKLGGFLFLIKLLAFLATNIYFPNTNRRLERSFRLGFNSFIKHFIPEI